MTFWHELQWLPPGTSSRYTSCRLLLILNWSERQIDPCVNHSHFYVSFSHGWILDTIVTMAYLSTRQHPLIGIYGSGTMYFHSIRTPYGSAWSGLKRISRLQSGQFIIVSHYHFQVIKLMRFLWVWEALPRARMDELVTGPNGKTDFRTG